MFYVKGIALRTNKDDNDYTNPETGEVLPNYTTLIVDADGYTKRINSNVLPTLEANKEYVFPVLIFPFVDKKDATKAKMFMKLNTKEDIQAVTSL